MSHEFLVGAGGVRLGRAPHRLGRRPPDRPGCRRHPGRRRAGLSQEPFARRIRVRPGLGRGLRGGRRALLPQAPGRRCRSRRAPARACWCGRAATPPRSAACLAGALAALARQTGASSVHVTFPTGREWAELGEARLAAAHRPAVPVDEPRLRQSFEAFLEDLAARKRKAIRRERREALATRHRDPPPDRLRPDRGGVGRLLRLLHGYRLAQMGPALSDPRLLLAGVGAHGRHASCW